MNGARSCHRSTFTSRQHLHTHSKGYCLIRLSTSAASGPCWSAASSWSSTNLFSSNSSMSTFLKREECVFLAIGATVSPRSAVLSAVTVHALWWQMSVCGDNRRHDRHIETLSKIDEEIVKSSVLCLCYATTWAVSVYRLRTAYLMWKVW